MKNIIINNGGINLHTASKSCHFAKIILALIALCALAPTSALAETRFNVAWDQGWAKGLKGTVYINIGVGPNNIGYNFIPLSVNHTNEAVAFTGYRDFNVAAGSTVHVSIVHDFQNKRRVYYRRFVMPQEDLTGPVSVDLRNSQPSWAGFGNGSPDGSVQLASPQQRNVVQIPPVLQKLTGVYNPQKWYAVSRTTFNDASGANAYVNSFKSKGWRAFSANVEGSIKVVVGPYNDKKSTSLAIVAMAVDGMGLPLDAKPPSVSP